MQNYKTMFYNEKLTCLVIQGDKQYKAFTRGIQPLLQMIDQQTLYDSMILDKVVGKAAAMLMIYGGVKEVYAITISQHALSCFHKHNIKIHYDHMVPYIINRKGNGMCPMEETVLDCEDIQEAYRLLCKKVKQM